MDFICILPALFSAFTGILFALKFLTDEYVEPADVASTIIFISTPLFFALMSA